ncbi:MAG TPA: dTDP-4-dehydrorhamnose 3,5-epimerase, partial [Hyphomonas atlantica]|nr:dTDP-4-dehydrorhamnose 3,5-epimerase [Hyphomonas atlantica]HBQ49865.1 dTDP-4-dehydrorhamnose 3,5-epimerase [Hyphomonas atlantica]
GRAMSVELCADSGAQLFIPRGFAHGFCTLEDDTEVVYKTDAYYAPSHDYGIAHDDPAIAIDWPVPPHARILSDKDRALPSLADYLKLESIHEEER